MAKYVGWMPYSFIWFALTALIFALQLLPITGVFLMLVMAPLWSIATVNLGFISLGLEAALGVTSRLWLIAPVAWFGGYALLAEFSQRALVAAATEISAANSGVAVAFDPTRQALVFVGREADLAKRLLLPYHLPVAFSSSSAARKERRDTDVPDREQRHTAYRIGALDVCERIRADGRFNAAGISGAAISSEGASDRKAPRDACIYSLPEDPALPTVTVSITKTTDHSLLLRRHRSSITITEPDGRASTLVSGYAAPLSRWPMPVMGCGLNSGRPAWECDIGFWREKLRGVGGEGAYGGADVEVIAAALGLTRQRWTPAELSALGAPTLDAVLAGSEQASIKTFETILADPRVKASSHELRGLAEQPALLARRAEEIVAAVSMAVERGDGDDETLTNLQRLFAALPDAEFARHGPRLVALLERDIVPASEHIRRAKASPKPRRLKVEHTLLTRSGDLGAVALPLLERNLRQSDPAAVLGLCRMGEPAARLAERLADLATEKRRQDGTFRAIYLTLLRLGRADLADRLVPPDEDEYVGETVRVRRSDFPSLRQEITSESPSSVCSANHRGDRSSRLVPPPRPDP